MEVTTFGEFQFNRELRGALRDLEDIGIKISYSPTETPTTLRPDEDLDILFTNIKIFGVKGIIPGEREEIIQILKKRKFHYLKESPLDKLCG